MQLKYIGNIHALNSHGGSNTSKVAGLQREVYFHHYKGRPKRRYDSYYI